MNFRLPLLFLILAGAVSAAGIDVKIDGEKSFHVRELMDALPDMPEKLNDDQVKSWSEDAGYAIENFYQQSGFFQVKVEAEVQDVKEAGKKWNVLFHVSEGPSYRFGKVRVLVAEDSSVVFPPGNLKTVEGQPYVEEDLSQDQRQITRVFGNEGFVRARVTEESIQRDSTRSVDIVYHVNRGLAVVFDTLRVNIRRVPPLDSLEGLTRENLLRELVPYHRGDTVRIDPNDKVIEKLQSTGLYNSVRLEDSALADGKGSALILDVEEKVPGHATGSVFFETQYGLGVSGTVVHSNIAGSMKEASLGSEFAQHKQSFSAGFGSPLIWNLLLRFNDNALVEWYQDQLPGTPIFAGDFHASNTASLSRTFNAWLRGVSSFELDYLDQFVVDTGTTALTREKLSSVDLVNTAFISFVDQDLNPTRGVRYALTWGNGSAIDGWQTLYDRSNWLQIQSAYYYYVPPWDQFKAALRLDGGRFFGNGGENSNRFFLGGPRNVRSYDFEQLCPDAPPPSVGACPLQQEPLEPAYFLVSAELRLSPFDFSAVDTRGFVKYLKPLGIVPFVDYGKVWNLYGDDHFSFTRRFFSSGYGRGIAYGGGLRYPLLGIFDFRLDLACAVPAAGIGLMNGWSTWPKPFKGRILIPGGGSNVPRPAWKIMVSPVCSGGASDSGNLRGMGRGQRVPAFRGARLLYHLLPGSPADPRHRRRGDIFRNRNRTGGTARPCA